MKRYSTVRLLGLGAAALALEATLTERVGFLGGRPEPLLILACFAALFARDARQALPAAWLLGLAKDLGSACPFGLYSFLFLTIAWSLQPLRTLLDREHPLLQFGIALLAALVTNLTAAIVVCVVTGGIPFWTILRASLAGALFTGALAPPILFLLRTRRSFLE